MSYCSWLRVNKGGHIVGAGFSRGAWWMLDIAAQYPQIFNAIVVVGGYLAGSLTELDQRRSACKRVQACANAFRHGVAFVAWHACMCMYTCAHVCMCACVCHALVLLIQIVAASWLLKPSIVVATAKHCCSIMCVLLSSPPPSLTEREPRRLASTWRVPTFAAISEVDEHDRVGKFVPFFDSLQKINGMEAAPWKNSTTLFAYLPTYPYYYCNNN